MRNFDVPRHIVNYARLLLCDIFFKQTLEQETEFPWSSSENTCGKVYAAEPHAALALMSQRSIVDRVPTAKPKKLQNHQTELKVIICDCHMKLAKWKAIFWRNKCIFCNWWWLIWKIGCLLLKQVALLFRIYNMIN